MYWTFGVSVVCLLHPVLSADPVRRAGHPRARSSFRLEMGLVAFTVVAFVLGFFMSLGKAAVYKHIPVYYPQHVGAVGGVVGLVGGLGGFVLPIVFGALNDLTGVWQSCFMAAVPHRRGVAGLDASRRSAAWSRASTARQLSEAARAARDAGDPRAQARRRARAAGSSRTGAPRTRTFWERRGARSRGATCGSRSRALLLSFAVWMVWSVVVAKLPAIGFTYTTDQLFWLAALPGLSGATLRIFYSFMPCRSSAAGCGRRSPPGRC